MNEDHMISIVSEDKSANINNVVVRGEFKIPDSESSVIAKGKDVLKHVVLVITRSANYQASAPFSKVVVFEDDVKLVSDTVFGFFSIKLGEHLKFDGDGDFYVMCSLGVCLSNIIKITVES